MLKKMMFCAAFVAALFTSCSSEDDFAASKVDDGNIELVIKADLESDTRFGFTEAENKLTAQFQEGDRIVAWPRWAGGATNGKAFFLTYQGMEEGKAVFRAIINAGTIGNGTRKFHMLLCNGFEFKDETNLQVLNLQDQAGTLASAAQYTVYQADPAMYLASVPEKVVISNVKFFAKTAVIKYTFTAPEGVTVPVGTPIVINTKDVMHHVGIAWGVPNDNSLPITEGVKGKGDAVFYAKIGEVNENTLTAYLSVCRGEVGTAVSATTVEMGIGDNI